MTGLTITASITTSGGGGATNFSLFDDGAHDDGVAGDGVYGGSQTLTGTGLFDLAIITSGESNLGSFQRQQTGSFTIGAAESTLSGSFTESAPDANADGLYDSLNWGFTIYVPRAGDYTVSGDLTDKDGATVADAIVQIKASSAGMQPITLTFLGQDIYVSGREGPYTLKNLQIIVTTSDGEFLSGRPVETATTGGPYWSWLLFERAETPLVKWLTPTSEEATRGGSFELMWAVADGNGGTTIDIYYDTTGSGFAGTPIVTGLEAIKGEMSYTWSLGSLPDGLYYVYARVRNGDLSNAVYGGSVRKLTDTDTDGMPDSWETPRGLNPNSAADAYLDPDNDLLTNLDEYLNNTNPQAADTDGGGEKDGSEVLNGRDPLTASDDATGMTLLAVSPGQGDSRGGDQVMVLGSGFQNGVTVNFGGVAAPSVTFINSTKLLVTTPAQAVSLTSVTVTNPASGGSVTKPDAFMFLFQFIEPPIAGSNGPICAGATLNLVASTISGATYSWTGPNGFTSSQQNPSIPLATTTASGTYTVTVAIPGYTFPPATTNVTVNPIPSTPMISAPSSVAPGATGLMANVANNAGSFYNWTITNGTITVGQGTNQITFTAGVGGTLSLQVTEANSSGCQSATANMNIPVCAYSLSPTSQSFNASGGSGNVTVTVTNAACAWTATSNDAWITLSTFNGIGNGSVGFMVAANTGAQRTGTATIAGQTFTVTQDTFVCPQITINPLTLPNGFVGMLYTQALGATGGTPSYSFTLDSGSFPPGVGISGTNLTGTPTTTGIYNFTIKATDSLICTGTRAYTVVVSGTGLQFYPLAHPVRMVDTRIGATACQTPSAAITGNTSLTVPARGVCDGLTIPANAAAVTGNVTTVGPVAAGFLTIYPNGATRPQASNSNYQTGQTLNNVFTVGVGAADGAFNVYALSTTNVVVDVTGYFAPPGANGLFFHPLPAPVRLLDTRNGQTACTTPGTPLLAATEFLQQGNAICGIPATALALVGNATTVGPLAQGFLTLFPADANRPLIASGNYQLGQTLNSPFTVGLSPSGQFKIYSLQQTNLVIDVLGYYSADASDTVGIGLLFTPMTPARLLDTRFGQTACFTPGVAIAATTDTPQAARGICTIPATAQAIVGNATTVSPASGGFLTFWPSNATRPNAATSNFAAGVNFNRHYTVGLGADGAFKIYALTSTHLVVDVSGSFAP